MDLQYVLEFATWATAQMTTHSYTTVNRLSIYFNTSRETYSLLFGVGSVEARLFFFFLITIHINVSSVH